MFHEVPMMFHEVPIMLYKVTMWLCIFFPWSWSCLCWAVIVLRLLLVLVLQLPCCGCAYFFPGLYFAFIYNFSKLVQNLATCASGGTVVCSGGI